MEMSLIYFGLGFVAAILIVAIEKDINKTIAIRNEMEKLIEQHKENDTKNKGNNQE